jgi:hypothetical protein
MDAELELKREPAGPKGRAKLQYRDGDLLVLVYAPAEFSHRELTLSFPEIPAPASAPAGGSKEPTPTLYGLPAPEELAALLKWAEAAGYKATPAKAPKKKKGV